jgi:hypothetical protein
MKFPNIFQTLLSSAAHQPDEAALSAIGNHKCVSKQRTIELFAVFDMARLWLFPSFVLDTIRAYQARGSPSD